MTLIRNDLSTVLCEVTSSLRTISVEDETTGSGSGDEATKADVQELLLCFRPIRDGEKKVDESLRFVPRSSVEPPSDSTRGVVSSSSGDVQAKGDSEKTSSSLSNSSKSDGDGLKRKKPPKKRTLPMSKSGGNETSKRLKVDAPKKAPHASDTEKSVVESLMLIKKSQ